MSDKLIPGCGSEHSVSLKNIATWGQTQRQPFLQIPIMLVWWYFHGEKSRKTSVGLTRLQVTDMEWQTVEGTCLRWNLLSLGIQKSFDISRWGSIKKHVGLKNNWKQGLKYLCVPVSAQFSCRPAFFAHHNMAAGGSQFYILELQYIKLYIRSLEKSELTLLGSKSKPMRRSSLA